MYIKYYVLFMQSSFMPWKLGLSTPLVLAVHIFKLELLHFNAVNGIE